jgi:hypothetical protein
MDDSNDSDDDEQESNSDREATEFETGKDDGEGSDEV